MKNPPKLKLVPFTPGSGKEPNLKSKTHYLVKYDGEWHAGTFTKQWYGWYFNGVYDAGCQMDYPGWQVIYEIVERKQRCSPKKK